MTQTFTLPAVGDTMVEATITEWFVAVGDDVALDQIICSIETDKSTVEMSSPFAGTITSLGGAVGDIVAVGEPLLIVGVAGEQVALDTAATTAASISAPALEEALPPTATGTVRSPLVRRLATELGVDITQIRGTGAGGAITRGDVHSAAIRIPSPAPIGSVAPKAMPKVRRAAREQSIDLTHIRGTGPDGAILLADLDASSSAPGERRVPLSATRRAIGDHLTTSVQTVPQFTSMIDVDASSLMALRQQLEKRSDSSVPIDAIVMSLLIPVLRDHPMMNARLDTEANEIVIFEHHDIGIAVDAPDGLMVPVVRNAGQRSIDDLSAEILRLAVAARARRLSPEEILGATATLNNVGAVGIEAGTPILPVGTTAIIAPGRARPAVQIRNGHAVAVPLMTISATFDHRVVDGGDAGRFLTQLRDHLEVPAIGLL